MKAYRLYPVRDVAAQDLSKEKVVVLPRQSMSLKEIISRFIKRESLPAEKQGIYEDRYDHDLEKLSKEDRVIQDEVIEELKVRTKDLDSKVKDFQKAEADKAAAIEKAEVDKRIAAAALAASGIKS